MTVDRRAALGEKVAWGICMGWGPKCLERCPDCQDGARGAAIDIALEEAARIADHFHYVVEQRRDLFEDGNITTTKGYSLVDSRKLAAAIRALKDKP